MDYSEKIFKILGVEPNERFKIKEAPNCLFAINEKLNVKVATEENKDVWMRALDCLPALLNGTYTIEKNIKPTEEEQIVIKYAKLSGYKWLAKDEDGKVYAYNNKPQKSFDVFNQWVTFKKKDEKSSMKIYFPISFLSWEDDEPYYIGD